jgi:glucose dehydrogenase
VAETYAGDAGATRYSPLDQINASNFNKLEVAWRFKTDSLGPHPSISTNRPDRTIANSTQHERTSKHVEDLLVCFDSEKV